MGDLMQQAFDAIKNQRGQSRLTGNQQLMGGANQDEPLYEGYFDAMMKNRRADRAQAIQQEQFNRQMLMSNRQMNMNEKMIKQSNALGWGQLGAQALGYGMKAMQPAIDRWLAPSQATTQSETQSLGGSYGGSQFSDDQYPAFTPYDKALTDMYDPSSTTSFMGDWFGDWFGDLFKMFDFSFDVF